MHVHVSGSAENVEGADHHVGAVCDIGEQCRQIFGCFFFVGNSHRVARAVHMLNRNCELGRGVV
nr:MAG TPA: hypothetical protein [Caudoviricetes sp.]